MTASDKIQLSEGVEKIFETAPGESFKFGYYNICPISADGKKLLAHKIGFEGRLPTINDKIEIGYFSLPDGRWHQLTHSRVFNWQQGCMLQWLGPDYNNRIIFNDISDDGKRYVSRIFDVRTNAERIIPHAIYAVHPSGDFSVSLNFERCDFTRAYSYSVVNDDRWNEPLPNIDGLLKIDLNTGNAEPLIWLKDVVSFDRQPDFAGAAHWLEHIFFNPSGSRFAFYHRYEKDKGFASRVFTCDITGKDLWLHPFKEDEKYSHIGWRNDCEYALFMSKSSKIRSAWVNAADKGKTNILKLIYRKFVKPFLPRKIVQKIPQAHAFYVLANDKSDYVTPFQIQPPGLDGHPSFTRSGRYMLTDTYADVNRYRNLLIYDLQLKKTHLLGRFFSVYNSTQWRADLHPRFSHDENHVIIDSNHQGCCQMLVLKLDWRRFEG